MGIHGLTTYLRENKRQVSESFEASSSSEPVNVVVDGLSFVYQLLYHSNLPWVYGGEYPEIARLTRLVVGKWNSVGFNVAFVFDGPTPRVKISTVTSRATKSKVQPSLLFFRTSPATRSTSRFLSNPRILPPLTFDTVLNALKQIEEVEVYFADEECDPFAVELAGRLGAYVIGNDSDFVVLNSDGYKGYIPMEEMVWLASPLPTQSSEPDESLEWVSSTSKRQKNRDNSSFGKGIIPPSDTAAPVTLSYSCYTPVALANHLKIPPSILPILGALIGNDFTNESASTSRNYHSIFFERRLTLSGRIGKVAATLRSILNSAADPKRKGKQRVEGVLDLIDRTVKVLVATSPLILATGEIDAIVDNVVDSTLQYAIPKPDEGANLWPTDLCPLHPPEQCPLVSVLSRKLNRQNDVGSDEQSDSDSILLRYLDAYRQGLISPLVMDSINTGTFWPRVFLENPDLETVGRLGRSLRQIGYAILDNAVGLPEIAEDAATEPPESSVEDSEDEDELVDVIENRSDEEEDSDPLKPLRNTLDRLQGDDQDSVASNVPPPPRKARSIIEYVRRGTRVADEVVPVPALTELILLGDYGDQGQLGPLSQSSSDRLATLLEALQSNVAAIRKLERVQLIPVLALRLVLRYFYERAKENPGKDRDNERWTVSEARCFIAAFNWLSQPDEAELAEAIVPIEDRNVQLTAQALQAVESVQHLVQIMLLITEVPMTGHRFSGRRFHALLTGTWPPAGSNIPDSTWEACVDGLDVALKDDKKKKKQKAKKVSPPTSTTKGTGPRRGVFDMLGDAEA